MEELANSGQSKFTYVPLDCLKFQLYQKLLVIRSLFCGIEAIQILSNLSLLFSIGGFNGSGMYGSSNISGFSVWSAGGCVFELSFLLSVVLFTR